MCFAERVVVVPGTMHPAPVHKSLTSRPPEIFFSGNREKYDNVMARNFPPATRPNAHDRNRRTPMTATEETVVPPPNLDLVVVDRLIEKLREADSATAGYMLARLEFLLPDPWERGRDED